VENLPKKVGWFQEYQGDMLVCALGSKEHDEEFPDMLNIALQFAKQRLLEKKLNEVDIDLEKVKNGVNRVERKIEEFSIIKRKTTSIQKACKDIDEKANDLRDEIQSELTEMSTAIN